jgi:hypothetical protein
MISRAAMVAAVSLALVPTAAAAKGRLVVDPGSPVVGVRTLIDVRTTAPAPLYLRLTSPTGVQRRLRLTRVAPGLWRAAFHFPDDGQWTLRVVRANAGAKVTVLQPGAALPPFKPNHAGAAKASSLSGLAAPGVVIGR